MPATLCGSTYSSKPVGSRPSSQVSTFGFPTKSCALYRALIARSTRTSCGNSAGSRSPTQAPR